MLNLVFGFNARIPRLQFFLASVVLGLAMGVFVVAYGMHAVRSAAHAQPIEIATSWPMLIAIAVFGYATFNLQSMRFRDIGWDPVLVIPVWIAIVVIDHMVAVKFPGLSISKEHSHTAVGALVNLGLYLSLAFWPSGEFSRPPQSDDSSRLPPASPNRGAASDARLRAATGAGGGFGRRAT